MIELLLEAFRSLLRPREPSRCQARHHNFRCEKHAGHKGEHRCFIDRGHMGPKYHLNWEDEIGENP